MVLFIIAAVLNMTILQVNLRRGHKFYFSGMLFGFCMARITTCIMRIVWANRQTSINIGIAATVFVAAGVVLLFAINTVFAQRILRAMHPKFGWSKTIKAVFTGLYVLIIVSLIMLITATVDSFFTLNMNVRRIDRDIQLYGQTYYTFLSFLPIPLVLISLAFPRKTRTDKFGSGRHRDKIWILLIASALLCLGAAFRTGTNYITPRPRSSPAWYHSKACFYLFNFTIEITVIYLYLLLRVDKRFHVPDGARGPGSYRREALKASPADSSVGLPTEPNPDNDDVLLASLSQAHVQDHDVEEGIAADSRASSSLTKASPESLNKASSESLDKPSSESLKKGSSESLNKASSESPKKASFESINKPSSESLKRASSESLKKASSIPDQKLQS